MSTTKNVTTLIKKSVVASTVPTTSNLVIGELAVNHADGKLYAVHTTSGVVDGVTLLNPAGGGGSFDGSNVAITGGSISGVTLSTPGDIVVNGMTIGLGNNATASNIAFGTRALNVINADPGDTTNGFNVAIGTDALGRQVSGRNNLAIGSGALVSLTAAGYNTAIGGGTLGGLTTGQFNIGIGSFAGGGGFETNYLTTGSNNMYFGYQTVPASNNESNFLRIGTASTGVQAIHVGTNSGSKNTINTNISIGQNAYQNGVYSQNNVVIGPNAGQNLGATAIAGSFVVGNAYKIISSGTTDFTLIGSANSNVGTTFTATGVGSGSGTAAPTAAERSVIIGQNAATKSTVGARNVVVGRGAMQWNTTGYRNTAIGQGAQTYTQGFYNTTVGQGAGFYLPGNYNSAIGAAALLAEGYAFAGYFEIGQQYMIADAQNTNWTSIGAANSSEGTIFTATGSGTGNGSAALLNTAYGNRNVGVGYRAGAGATSSGSATKGNDNIYVGYQTAPLTKIDTNCIVIGSSAVGLGSNSTVIGNSSTTITKVFGKLIINDAPASSIGAAGDVAGMIAVDANYIYHCTATYDGSTSIWKRLAGTTW